MKLYVWTGKDVLPNCGSGIAIAYASSLEEARELVKAGVIKEYDWMYSLSYPIDPDDIAFLEERCAFVNRDPDIHDTSIAFCIPGSY